MASFSILFPGGAPELATAPPACFDDLNLGQVVDAVVAGRAEYALEPFLYTPLRSVDAIVYRQEVFRDLELGPLPRCVGAFAEGMRIVRKRLTAASQMRHVLQRQRWFLDAARGYVDAVRAFSGALAGIEARSDGVREFQRLLGEYVDSSAFSRLDDDERAVRGLLRDIRYALEIAGSRVTVSRYEDEDDYGAEVAATFAKFKQGDVRDHHVKFTDAPEMNHVEAGVLERVAKLHPQAFGALETFCERHHGFVADDVAAFDSEVQFYLAWHALGARLDRAGLAVCYPRVSADSKAVAASDTFDLALAAKLVGTGGRVVVNDFELDGPERIFVVTGPNQGGKTTFARTFGQLHYLAALGCPVPGAEVRLFLCDEVFTHFEREEALGDLRGKLEDELIRVHEIVERATPASVVILNETFTSTTLADAVELGTRVLEQLIERDVLGVCVTFVDELASLVVSVVSVVSTVDPDDVAVRTFKLVRRDADGLSYARAIAAEHGLTYGRLKERIAA